MNTALQLLVAMARADTDAPPERILQFGAVEPEPEWTTALRTLLERMLVQPAEGDAERQHQLVNEARTAFQALQKDWHREFETGLMNDSVQPLLEATHLMQEKQPFENVGVYQIVPCSRCHTETLRRDADSPVLDIPVPGGTKQITMEALVLSFYTTESPRVDVTCSACSQNQEDKTQAVVRVAPFSHLPKTFVLHLQRNFNHRNEDAGLVTTRVTDWNRLTVFPHPAAPVTYRAVAVALFAGLHWWPAAVPTLPAVGESGQ